MAQRQGCHLISEENWYGCYGPRGDLFLPESNVHPAKMAVGLCYRIFEHGRQRGYWQPGDVVLDPMAGIFTTGIVGASLGYRVVGVELEQHFLALARKNIEAAFAIGPYYTQRLLPRAAPAPVLLGGDARRLAAILKENYWFLDGWQQALDSTAAAAVTSPPYVDAVPCQDKDF
ncbi:MAG: hypothetical protein L0212_00785, partial [Acidobacteria bacterium]|nr:hypothetical protein [Acidobacteriota bacterium]